MGPKSRSGGPDGYLRPVQFLDHLTVIKTNTHTSDLLVMQILLRLQKSWEEAVLSSFLRQTPPLSG